MKVFSMPEGAGKTRLMVGWLLEPTTEDRLLVVANTARRREVLALLSGMGPGFRAGSEARVLLAADVIREGRARLRGAVLGVDDLDKVLEVLLGAPVVLASATCAERAEESEFKVRHCSACGEPQAWSPWGMVCRNGHGGAPAAEDTPGPG